MNFQQDSQSEHVWVSAFDPMPDVCCSCGMFTDHRVRVKHVNLIQQSGPAESGCAMTLIMLFVHVALGPLGWLISILINGSKDENELKTVKEKTKLKISQCLLCAGSGAPEVVDARSPGRDNAARLLFLVHPNFKRRFQEEQEKAASQ